MHYNVEYKNKYSSRNGNITCLHLFVFHLFRSISKMQCRRIVVFFIFALLMMPSSIPVQQKKVKFNGVKSGIAVCLAHDESEIFRLNKIHLGLQWNSIFIYIIIMYKNKQKNTNIISDHTSEMQIDCFYGQK